MADEEFSRDGSAYSGRWIALLRGRIVAQGSTREETLQAASLTRPKEIARLVILPAQLNTKAIQAISRLVPSGVQVYLVGGAPRDFLLGKTTKDLDFAVSKGGLVLAKKIAGHLNAAYYPMDEANDTGRVVVENRDGTREILDFTGFRGQDLEADLHGRDFTINSIAMDLSTGELIDPLKGASDLREKLIRASSPESFTDDPVRILRAVRLALALGFAIDPQTLQLMKSAVKGIGAVSPERKRDELFKILDGNQVEAGVSILERIGILPELLPDLVMLKGVEQSAPHVHDVWIHTLAALRHLEAILAVLSPTYDEEKAADLLNGLLVLHLGRYRNQINAHLGLTLSQDRTGRALLFFATLFHDVSKPGKKTVENGRIRFLGHDEQGALVAVKKGMAFHLSNDELDRLRTIVRQHMRIHNLANHRTGKEVEVSRRAIYRFFKDAGPAGIDLVLLSLADLRGTYDHTLTEPIWTAELEVCRKLLEAWFEKPEEAVHPVQLVNGNDLIEEFGLKPGRLVGRLLEAIRENQAEGKISSREEALVFAREWLARELDKEQKEEKSWKK